MKDKHKKVKEKQKQDNKVEESDDKPQIGILFMLSFDFLMSLIQIYTSRGSYVVDYPSHVSEAM